MVDTHIIQWLLDEDNPSVRYFCLKDLLNKEEDEQELKAARSLIAKSQIVSKIFSKQSPKGYWEDPDSPYQPKYKASYWQIMILSQLGMDRSDPRVAKACESIFQFQHKEGGFSGETEKTALREYNWCLKRGEQLPEFKKWMANKIYEGQMSCLTGNMVAALIRLGYKDDRRAKKALQWLVQVQNKDGGWLCPYWQAHIKDEHSCFMGTITPLDAFSQVPAKSRTREMVRAIHRGAEFLLMHHLFKADHHHFKVINEAWLRLTFPGFFYTILRGLDVLVRLGYSKDKRMNDALNILRQKRQSDGRWVLEHAPIGRMHANIDVVGKPSKWITLIACRVLQHVPGH